ncbi:MAG: sulfotransferase family 2 domain-containing protein [Chloroflexaceae bacterium]|nr:sulfotransferase family 2 domain-containing protein [Chloroflexaceae bacterium]
MSTSAIQSRRHQLREQDLLCLLDCYRVGGTTLATIVQRFFAPKAVARMKHEPLSRLESILPNLSQTRFVHTSYHYATIHRLLPRKPVCITLLRHPLERTLSLYRYQVQSMAWFHVRPVTLSDFLQNTNGVRNMGKWNNHGNLYNHQAAVLAGIGHTRGEQMSDALVVAIAKTHLDSCAFVGLTERFDDSLRLLCYTFGWSPIEHYISQNVTPAELRPEITPAQEALILKQNALDLELYTYAQQLFTRRLQQMEAEQALLGV